MSKYFTGICTLDDLKREYKRLAMKHHPDHGGDLRIMQEINAEYDALFMDWRRGVKFDAGKATTAHGTMYEDETPEAYRAIIEILLHLDGLEIELCGAWLWIGGKTRENKEALKAAGCLWSKNKAKWYWRPTSCRSFNRGHSWNMDEIRSAYGSDKISARDDDRQRITA